MTGCVPASASFAVQNDENELLILSGLFQPVLIVRIPVNPTKETDVMATGVPL